MHFFIFLNIPASMSTIMTSQMKHITIATAAIESVGFLLLTISIFSSSWIQGHYPPYHNVSKLSSYVVEMNISESCTEGLFLVCCEINTFNGNQSVWIYLTERSCRQWQKNDFTGINLCE